MSEGTETGSVITFYSYKGGTGRSMALANIACLLAERVASSKPVLMIDWDLEAPGLHRFFHGRLWRQTSSNRFSQANIEEHPGLIELFRKLDGSIPDEPAEDLNQVEQETQKVLDALALDEYVLNTDVRSLQLIKAGAFDSGYATRVNSFRWDRLHARSPFLFTLFAQKLAQHFSHVLIDSRTGLTDTSGICTSLMPEKLIVVFTPNRQSLGGVTDLVRQALEYRGRAEDERPLLVYPLPSRIESTREDQRRAWRYGNPEKQIEGYQPQFEALFSQAYALPECSLDHYFNDVQIQQSPDYAYGEEIAALIEKQEDRFSLKHSYKTFWGWVESGSKPWERLQQETVPIAEVREIESKVSAAEEKVTAAEQTAKRLRSRLKIAVGVVLGLGAVVAFFFVVLVLWSSKSYESHVDSVAISADARYVAACRFGGELRIWQRNDATTDYEVLTPPSPPRCSQVFFSEATRSVVVTDYSGVWVWEHKKGMSPQIHTVSADKSALSVNGVWLVAASLDGEQISLLNLQDKSPSPSMLAAAKEGWSIRDLAVSIDGKVVAAGTDKGVLLWRESASGSQPLAAPGPEGNSYVWSVHLSPDGKILIACQSELLKWQTAEFGGSPEALPRRCGIETGISPNGEFFATGYSDFTVSSTDESSSAQAPLLSSRISPRSLAFSSDSSRLVLGTDDARVLVWSMQNLTASPLELAY